MHRNEPVTVASNRAATAIDRDRPFAKLDRDDQRAAPERAVDAEGDGFAWAREIVFDRATGPVGKAADEEDEDKDGADDAGGTKPVRAFLAGATVPTLGAPTVDAEVVATRLSLGSLGGIEVVDGGLLDERGADAIREAGAVERDSISVFGFRLDVFVGTGRREPSAERALTPASRSSKFFKDRRAARTRADRFARSSPDRLPIGPLLDVFEPSGGDATGWATVSVPGRDESLDPPDDAAGFEADGRVSTLAPGKRSLGEVGPAS